MYYYDRIRYLSCSYEAQKSVAVALSTAFAFRNTYSTQSRAETSEGLDCRALSLAFTCLLNRVNGTEKKKRCSLHLLQERTQITSRQQATEDSWRTTLIFGGVVPLTIVDTEGGETTEEAKITADPVPVPEQRALGKGPCAIPSRLKRVRGARRPGSGFERCTPPMQVGGSGVPKSPNLLLFNLDNFLFEAKSSCGEE